MARNEPVPRIRGARPRLRQPKVPRLKETLDTARLGKEYLRKRNYNLDLKNMRESMRLAHEREQLVEKKLVERQLGWLLISMRQKTLSLPVKIANHFGGRDVPIREVVEYTKRLVNETLTELSRLPECVEPDWLEKLEEEV